MSRDRKVLLPACAAVFACAFLAYASSFGNRFLYGDDQNIVTNNLYLGDWSALPRFFTRNYIAGAGLASNFYRPAQMTIYALIVHAVGRVPWAFHLASVGFHGLCGVLLLLLLLELLPQADLALCAALAALWTMHPIAAEEIAMTTGLATPAYTAALLAAVLCFLRALESGTRAFAWRSAALAAFAFGLASKESAVVAPALLALAHWLRHPEKRDRASLLSHLPFWGLAAVYVGLRLTWLDFGGTLDFYQQGNAFTQSLTARLCTLSTALAYGGWAFAVPTTLAPHRDWPIFTSPRQVPVILSLAALAAAAALALAWRSRKPAVAAGLLWYLVCYAPFSNLWAKINAVFYDHWLYAPSIGLVLIAGALMQRPRRAPWPAIVGALALAFGIATSRRSLIWKDSASYFGMMVRQQPAVARNWTNYGISLMEQQLFPQAAMAFQRAIALQDEFPQSHHDLARSLLAMNQPAPAEAEYLRALKMDPGFYYSRVDLAGLYMRQGRKSEALTQLLALQKTFPQDAGLAQSIALLSAQPRR